MSASPSPSRPAWLSALTLSWPCPVMAVRLRSFKSMRDGSNTLHSIHRCIQTVALSDFMGVCCAF